MSDISTLIAFLPMLAIPFIIVLKIILRENFSSKIFRVIFSILCILSFFTLFIIFTMKQPFGGVLFDAPLIHKINYPLGFITIVYFSFYNKILILFLPILLICSLINYKKTKDFSLLKNLFISTLFLCILSAISIPTIIYPIYSVSQKRDNTITDFSQEIERSKKATMLSVIPAMKAAYSSNTASNLILLITEKYQNNKKIPNYSSDEAQKLLNEYIKYQEYSAKTRNITEYLWISLYCLQAERFDDALKYAQKISSKETIISSVYVAKGEYDKALKLVDKNPKFWAEKKKLAAIYIGLKEYDKAQKLIDLPADKHDYLWKPETQIYLNYKKGNISKANELYEEYKKTSNKFNSYSLAEFIQYNDRIDY